MDKVATINNFFLLLFVFSVTFEYWDPFGMQGLSISKIFASFYMASCIPLLSKRLNIDRFKYLYYTLLFYIFFELISSAVNFEHVYSINQLINLRLAQLVLLSIFVSSHVSDSPYLFDKVLKTYVYSVVLMAVLFYFGIGLDAGFDEATGTRRLKLFGENPNAIGIKATTAFVIIIGLLLENKAAGLYRKLLLVLFSLMILPLVSATGSRGAFVTLLFAGLIYLLLLRRNLKLKIPIVALGALIGVFLFDFFMSNELMQERLMVVFEEGDIGRGDLWRASWNIFLDNPWIGVGRGGFFPAMEEQVGRAMGSHNVFLEILATTGIFGFVFFCIFFLGIWKLALRDYLINKRVVILVLLAIITLHMGKAGGAIGSIYVWFILSITIGALYTTSGVGSKSRQKTNNLINENTFY